MNYATERLKEVHILLVTFNFLFMYMGGCFMDVRATWKSHFLHYEGPDDLTQAIS